MSTYDILLRLALGIKRQWNEGAHQKEAREEVSIFYNYSNDELVAGNDNDNDTTEAFEPADIVGYFGLSGSKEVVARHPDNVEVDNYSRNLENENHEMDSVAENMDNVPDPDNVDPLNLMGERSSISLQPSPTQPSRHQTIESSHILNTPVQGSSLQREEQEDEDMMAAALPLINILKKKQLVEEGQDLNRAIRTDLIQVLATTKSSFLNQPIPRR